ncbi:MAG: hypothetical protein E6Q97_27190 [Desulfurellales bacterium]|nr:MAG: hypothetical protein E6Q97_27190 [Desulfurellales bacterium]
MIKPFPSDRIGREIMKKRKGSNKADHFKFDVAINPETGEMMGVIICSHGFKKYTSIDAARECVKTWNRTIEVDNEKAEG